MKVSHSIHSICKSFVTFATCSSIGALLLMAQPSYAATIKHVVKQNETLSGLALRYNVSQTQLINTNGLEAVNLQIGQVLDIPDINDPITYRVRPGDSLYSVAKKHGTTITQLARINNIPTNASLDIADTLILPNNTVRSTTPSNNQSAGATSSATQSGASNFSQPANSVRKQAVGKHLIMKGETLSKIAKDYGVSLSALARANNLTNKSRIRYGESLIIPSKNQVRTAQRSQQPSQTVTAPTTYIVKRGEGLISIARKFNINVNELARANGLQGYEKLIIGQKLKLPVDARYGSRNQNVTVPQPAPSFNIYSYNGNQY